MPFCSMGSSYLTFCNLFFVDTEHYIMKRYANIILSSSIYILSFKHNFLVNKSNYTINCMLQYFIYLTNMLNQYYHKKLNYN